MLPARRGREIATAAVDWCRAWRIIASRYPPIELFERVSANPAVWEALIELESATNPRVRDEAGQISLVPPERRVSGPNASWVMAPFAHINPRGSRFSDGTWGVYYAADRLETAIAETIYHFEKLAADATDPPRREDMQVLVGRVTTTLHDVDTLPAAKRRAVLDPTSYAASRALARDLRSSGSNGLVFPSVRDSSGQCIAAFWPDVVGIPRQERHLQYEWDGRRVARYFDYQREQWISRP
jgi:RES domain-containing protein